MDRRTKKTSYKRCRDGTGIIIEIYENRKIAGFNCERLTEDP